MQRPATADWISILVRESESQGLSFVCRWIFLTDRPYIHDDGRLAQIYFVRSTNVTRLPFKRGGMSRKFLWRNLSQGHSTSLVGTDLFWRNVRLQHPVPHHAATIFFDLDGCTRASLVHHLLDASGVGDAAGSRNHDLRVGTGSRQWIFMDLTQAQIVRHQGHDKALGAEGTNDVANERLVRGHLLVGLETDIARTAFGSNVNSRVRTE
mmetsp:Transcript_9809/g.17328  ORF Transcript_9809/g.17328 Transcript_9809/m.17328 type:complete len:209 (-) Transcript_9809:1429-2055(-)